MIKDILLKAAEDVQSGMWCRETWFEGHNMDEEWEISANPAVVFQAISVVQMAQSKRCAEGSIVYAARLLGGTPTEAWLAMDAAARRGGKKNLFTINDDLGDDPFEAGQTLAELFRSTAEAL